jgi:TRAP-type transport system small permease protein
MSPRVRFVFRIIAEVLVIAFFALIAWVGYSVLDVLATDSLVSLPDIPVNYIQSVLPISAVLIILAEILTLPALLAQASTGGGADSSITGGSSH